MQHNAEFHKRKQKKNLSVLAEAKKYYKIKVQNYIDKMKNKKYYTVGTQ